MNKKHRANKQRFVRSVCKVAEIVSILQCVEYPSHDRQKKVELSGKEKSMAH